MCHSATGFQGSVVTPTVACKGHFQFFRLGYEDQVDHVAFASIAVRDSGRQVLQHAVELKAAVGCGKQFGGGDLFDVNRCF
jgi:hypothetical protein